MPPNLDIDPLDLVESERFARNGYPHELWTRLRAEAPVVYLEPPGHPPFWAVTKYADIVEVAAQPQIFSNAKGITFDLDLTGVEQMVEMLVFLDPPRHGPMRKAANRKFVKSAVKARMDEIERIATEVVDQAATNGETVEGDFVDTFAGPFPMAVISWMLGMPREDWKRAFDWTNEVIGKDDAEYRRPGESPEDTFNRARGEIHVYLKKLIEQRRANPGDDLVTELIQSEVDGVPLTPPQLLAYCELLVDAGNQTTRDAIAGGMEAFCDYPGEWERLQADLDLLPGAVEEVLRWVSPISHFLRTATEDYELHGQKIRAGDKVALYWASGNRDEDLYEDPFEFRIDRPARQNLVFGFGPHLCLGSHVARAELDIMFGLLARRLEFFEQCGPVERLNSAVNGAIKHLPLRYRLR